MIDRPDHRPHATLEDRVSVEDDGHGAEIERRPLIARHPFVVGFLAVTAAALVFWLGIRVGEALYGIFEGEGLLATVLGAMLVTTLVALAATGLWLVRRRPRHGGHRLRAGHRPS